VSGRGSTGSSSSRALAARLVAVIAVFRIAKPRAPRRRWQFAFTTSAASCRPRCTSWIPRNAGGPWHLACTR